MKTYEFPSSSSSKVYIAQINDNGLLSCQCPGWTVKREGKARYYKHLKKIVQDEKLSVVERDGQIFLASDGVTEGLVEEVAPVSKSSNLRFISPMLASKMPNGKAVDDFDSDRYVMEEKYDGHRLVVEVGDTVRAWSRLGNTRTLPVHLQKAVCSLPSGKYDGELIVPGSKSYGVTAGQNSGTEMLVLFDILEVLGVTTLHHSFDKRRGFLEEAYKAVTDTSVILSSQMAPSLSAVELIWGRGGEGAIIKDRTAQYHPGWRTPDWVKVKNIASATLTITGFEAGESGPYSVVALVDDSGIKTSVKTLNNQILREIAHDPESFIGRRLVISFQEKTPAGSYRHPGFDHFAGEGE